MSSFAGKKTPRLFGNENNFVHAPLDEADWQTTDTRHVPAAAAAGAQPVAVVSLPKPRDPQLKLAASISLANAAPAGGLIVNVRGNVVLYSDSTNGTDRLLIQYQDAPGDQTQALRTMVPGRLRRERYFNQLSVTWTVTAGSTATIEVYDDPDGALFIQD